MTLLTEGMSAADWAELSKLVKGADLYLKPAGGGWFFHLSTSKRWYETEIFSNPMDAARVLLLELRASRDA